MAGVEAEPAEEPLGSAEERRVYRWRRERFDALGFGPGEAQRLAMVGADWHRAETLLRRDGWPLELVYEELIP